MNKEMFDEFKVLISKEYDEELKDDEIVELAQNLINTFRVIYREPLE